MALASWLRGVRIPKGDTKPGKIQHFGANFDGTIFLETTELKPYSKIRGRMCIETRFMLKFTGIHVQLEADLYLKFSSQNGRNVYRKRTCILRNTETLKSGDQLSPIRHDVVPPVPEGKDLIVVILPGEKSNETNCENFLFTLSVPGDVLPAPFKTSYGSLTYKVVGYMKSSYGRYVQVAEKCLDFGGYNNLSENLDALKPLKIKRGLVDVSASVQAILILEKGAYIPEETVPFTMLVRNPGCIPLQICVFIAQKITYNVDGVPLSTCTRVDEMELFENCPEADTCWKGHLTIPKKQAPTYCHHNPAYEVKYAIQFKVHVENHGMIRGTTPLCIGTTRESVDELKVKVNSLQLPNNPWVGMRRRGSNSSIRSENSYRGHTHHKKQSLPSYSQVNSPVRSIESLPPPPAYDPDLELEDEQLTIRVPVPSTSESIDEE